MFQSSLRDSNILHALFPGTEVPGYFQSPLTELKPRRIINL